jgi:lipopolysaccharide export system protein LptA
MFYKLFILIFVSLSIFPQEYEITSENIEINTDLNTIRYENKVFFSSENIKFSADELKLNQNNDSFSAKGKPIKITFFDGSEFIEGEAEIVEIDSEKLVLSKNVSVIKSGNKINSEKMVVKLKKNDKS